MQNDTAATVMPGAQSGGQGLPEGKSVLTSAVGAFVQHLVRVVFPHVLGAMGVFFIGALCVYKFGLQDAPYGDWLKMLLFFIICAVYFPISFLYGILLAALASLRAAAGQLEGFITDFTCRLEKALSKKIDNMQEGVTKTQARIIVNAGLKEVVQSYKDNKASSSAKAVVVFLLSFVVYAARHVVFGKIKSGSGAEISPALFVASPAALAAAIFFNLKFTATLFLVLGYAIGFVFLSGQILLLVVL